MHSMFWLKNLEKKMTRKKKQSANKQLNQPKSLDEVYSLFKGKGGGVDAESIVNDSKHDPNTVSVWSCTHVIAKLIERCKKDIVSYDVIFDLEGNPHGCQLEIDRKAFRGVHYAFRIN